MALELAGLGFDVALHYRNSATEAAATARAVEAVGRRAIVLRRDFNLRSEAGSSAGYGDLVQEARDAHGELGVLVNNAALFTHDRLADFDRAKAQRQIDVNLIAPIELAQAFAAQLGENARGLIVNITDARLDDLTANYLSYSVAKAGLWAATQILARDLAPMIRVNAIAPGPALPWPGASKADLVALTRRYALGRGPQPEEIGRALAFLVQSPSITGQAITVDGGQHLRQHRHTASPGADNVPS